jgi:hypothetical protein
MGQIYPAEKRPILILASYCGDDDQSCVDTRPCLDCLQMCNVALASGTVEVLGSFGKPYPNSI